MSNLLILFNPKSGRSKSINRINYLKCKLKDKYEKIDIYESKKSKDIENKIEHDGNIYDYIMVSGGDGTLNETINGLMKLEKKPKLIYIPTGTVNDAGRMLKLKVSVKKMVKIINEEIYEKIDVCKLNDKYFLYAAGSGKYSNVSYDTNTKYKKTLGPVAYFMSAFKELNQDRDMDLIIENDKYLIKGRYYIMMLLNSKRLAGFRIHENIKTKLNDGKINLILFKKFTFKTSFIALSTFLLFGEKYRRYIEFFNVDNIKINSNKEIIYNIDGEYGFSSKEVEMKVINKAIEILVNKKVLKKYF